MRREASKSSDSRSLVSDCQIFSASLAGSSICNLGGRPRPQKSKLQKSGKTKVAKRKSGSACNSELRKEEDAFACSWFKEPVTETGGGGESRFRGAAAAGLLCMIDF